MRKNQLLYFLMSVITIGLLAVTSCGTTEAPKPYPFPNFTFEINDKTVTFTNTSDKAAMMSAA